MTARWHLGPISGFSFWWLLVTSPEILVFLFFMITDPKTDPAAARAPASSTPCRRAPRDAADRAKADRVRDEGRACSRSLAVVCIGPTGARPAPAARSPRRLAPLALRARRRGRARRLRRRARRREPVAGRGTARPHAASRARRAAAAGHDRALDRRLDAARRSRRPDRSHATSSTDLDLQARRAPAARPEPRVAGRRRAPCCVEPARNRSRAPPAGRSRSRAIGIDRLGLTLQPGQDQAPPTVVAAPRAWCRLAVYRGRPADGRPPRTRSAPFTHTFELQQSGGRFLIVGGSRRDRGAADAAGDAAGPRAAEASRRRSAAPERRAAGRARLPARRLPLRRCSNDYRR